MGVWVDSTEEASWNGRAGSTAGRTSWEHSAFVPVAAEFTSTAVEGFRLEVRWLWELTDPLDVLARLGVRPA